MWQHHKEKLFSPLLENYGPITCIKEFEGFWIIFLIGWQLVSNHRKFPDTSWILHTNIFSLDGIYEILLDKKLEHIWFRIWEKGTNVLGNFGKIGVFLITARWMGHRKLYIFGKKRLSAFQKYIVFYTYHKSIHLAVIRNSPIFPKFPSTLVPFSQIKNHINIRSGYKKQEICRYIPCKPIQKQKLYPLCN